MAAPPRTHEEFEAQIREFQARKAGLSTDGEENGEGVPLSAVAGSYVDVDISGGNKGKYSEEHVTSIAPNDDADVDDDYNATTLKDNKKTGFTAPASFLKDFLGGDKDYDPFGERRVPGIAEREDEYRAQRRKTMISLEKSDPFADGGKTPDAQSRTYQVIMREQALNKDQADLRKKLTEKAKAGDGENGDAAPKPAKRLRLDQAGVETPQTPVKKKCSCDIVKDTVMLNVCGTLVSALSKSVKPYLPTICTTITWRLNDQSAEVRQDAAKMISKIAIVMKIYEEEQLAGHLGDVLTENLADDCPEVLLCILEALNDLVVVMHKIKPDLLGRLTSILQNRNEEIQRNCINLVGSIADHCAEYVSRKDWMRVCVELILLIKGSTKVVRKSALNTFKYIVQAIGPHDVLATLLRYLKVHIGQNRDCAVNAIAIIMETCSPVTVLADLIKEYRASDLIVKTGIVKSLSLWFQNIDQIDQGYLFAITPVLEDALVNCDLVHRQAACVAVQHLALAVYGSGHEDVLIHLLNCIWPNILETSHLVQAFMGAVEALSVALGPITILQYCLQGLFHPARKVRDVYWKIYNTLYIGGQDSLVSGYPRIPDDSLNKFTRHELDYIL